MGTRAIDKMETGINAIKGLRPSGLKKLHNTGRAGSNPATLIRTMNIFAVDHSPEEAARSLCDKHVTKMIVESAQLLSTAHRLIDGEQYDGKTLSGRNAKRWRLTDSSRDDRIYQATFINHPCAIWARSCSSNYLWLAKHALAMCEEFELRYEHGHKTKGLIEFFVDNLPVRILHGPLEDFALAMPEEYKDSGNTVKSYRDYYIHVKARLAQWKLPDRMPFWFYHGCKSRGVDMLEHENIDAIMDFKAQCLAMPFNKP
mgnify:CR=1 FL=1